MPGSMYGVLALFTHPGFSIPHRSLGVTLLRSLSKSQGTRREPPTCLGFPKCKATLCLRPSSAAEWMLRFQGVCCGYKLSGQVTGTVFGTFSAMVSG